MGFNKQTLHKSATAFASGSPPSRGGRTALPPVHLDLFVVAVQLVGEEHQHPVHLDLSGMAVQLGGEENLLPVHLDFFVVAVQLSDEEHSPPVHLDLFVVSKEQNNLVITLQFYRLIIVHAEKRKGFKSSKKGEMLTGI